MKSIPVPKTAVPPAVPTLVIQITPTEAKELAELCEFFHRVSGSKLMASSSLLKHVNLFLGMLRPEDRP